MIRLGRLSFSFILLLDNHPFLCYYVDTMMGCYGHTSHSMEFHDTTSSFICQSIHGNFSPFSFAPVALIGFFLNNRKSRLASASRDHLLFDKAKHLPVVDFMDHTAVPSGLIGILRIWRFLQFFYPFLKLRHLRFII